MTSRQTKLAGGICAWLAAWVCVVWFRHRLAPTLAPHEAVMAVLLLLGVATTGGVLIVLAAPRLARFWEALGVTVCVCLPLPASLVLGQLPGIGSLWQKDDPGRYLVALTGVVTIWILFALLGRWHSAWREGAAIAAVQQSFSPSPKHEHEELQHWLAKSQEPAARLVARRLRLLIDTRANPSWPDLLAERAHLDASELQIAYGPVRALVWALPALGFIGTAGSMAGAIAGLSRALASGAQNHAQAALLTQAIPHLADAFGITLVALSASVLSFFAMALTCQREEQVLNDVDALMLSVVSRVQGATNSTHSDEPTDRLFAEPWSLEQVVTKLSDQLQRVLEGGGYAGTLSNLLTAMYSELQTFNDVASYWCDLRDQELAGPIGAAGSPTLLLREILQELKRIQSVENSGTHATSQTVGIAR